MDAATFLLTYPEFAVFTAEQVQPEIDLAAISCPEEIWLERQSAGIGLLVAHRLSCRLWQSAQTAGVGAAMAGGEGSPPGMIQGDSDLGLTVYGQRYRDMQRIVGSVVFVGG